MSTGSRSVRVGVVGCGNVSSRYLANLAGHPEVTVVACADVDVSRARSLAAAHAVPEFGSVDDVLASTGIDLVLNLTPPRAHAELTMRALEHDKHVYTEKPLATTLADGHRIVQLAQRHSMQVGTAPDTFLGAGPQTCARLIASGAIGTPISVAASMMNAGPERFHPEPEFLYKEGAGPLFDIGPYYVTVLTALLGSIVRVASVGTSPRSERLVLTGPRTGTRFPVETLTHVNTLLEFANGVLGTMVTSFDVVATRTPQVEVHGTEGTIVAPHANSWGGPVLVKSSRSTEFTEVLGANGAGDGFMGMGLVEMAQAILAGRPPLASATRGLHVLEVLTAISSSALAGGQFTEIRSTLADYDDVLREAPPASRAEGHEGDC